MAAAQQPVQGAPTPVDGPSADIARPSGLALSIARDGSGGLVYLKQVGGAPHVFVSPVIAGVFRPPVEVDSGLSGGSSQPVIAAANGGLLLVGFINGGELYVAQRASQSAPFGAPAGLAAGANNPSLSITNFPKAYLAFTVSAGGGSDVRTAYWDNGTWALEGPPLNTVAGDNAGTGTGRPDVAAAGDGVAIVVWGENGHVYSRRVWGTNPSVVDERADAPPPDCTESSADEPSVGAGGDSSYGAVAFREQITCAGHQQSRVLTNRLQASQYDGISNSDGLSGAPAEGAQDPQVAVTEYGAGWVTSERTATDGVFAQTLGQNTQPVGVGQVNSLPLATPPEPVPATAGLFSTFVTWQQQPGVSGPAEIRVRFAPAGSALGPEMVVSSAAQGPVDAADGIAAGGDVYGEAAVAWLQGAPGAATVMVEQMYQQPGSFSVGKSFRYATTAQPAFTWTTPHGWGPMKYSLLVDGALVDQTYANSAVPPTPLPNGPQSWQVFANNPAGQQSQTRVAPVFIDTVPPQAKLKLRGLAEIGSKLRASLSYGDRPPPGEPRSDASGVARLQIQWGDGTTTRLKLGSHLTDHSYRRSGHYRITMLVTDKAGNVTRVILKLKVVKSLRKGTRPKTYQAAPPTPSTGGGTPGAAERTRTAKRSRAPHATKRLAPTSAAAGTTGSTGATGPTGSAP